MCKRALCCLAGLAVAVAVALPIAAERRFSSDLDRINKAIQKAGQASALYHQRLEGQYRKLQPLFVVVPGILGSKLQKGEKLLWGELGLPNDRNRQELEFTDEPNSVPVVPLVMDRIGIKRLFDTDVYGTLSADLNFTSFTGVPWYDPFPYDWRDDIRISAKRLHEHMLAEKGTMRGRDVVIIAHSMGGLVVRWWYNTYYRSDAHKKEYDFLRPPRILFLGTPHFGSVAALRRLIHGFGADDTFSGLTNYVTSDLNAAAPTFYGVYELLPFSNADILFRSIEGQPSVMSDLLDVGLWQACRWGGDIAKRADFYVKILPARLAVAREFRDHMLRQEPIPNAVCFYSDSEKTPRTVNVRQHAKGACTVEIDEKADGDGSVVAEKTPYELKPAHVHTEIYRLQAAHMRLPNAHGFRSYIDSLRTRVLVESIVLADPDDDVIAAFEKADALFPLPLEAKMLEDPVTKQTLGIDRKILRRALGDKSDPELAVELYQMAVRAKNLSDIASQFYALALAFDPDGTHAPFAANNLAHNLLQNDLWSAARGYLEHAQQRIHLIPNGQKEFLMTLHGNTGVAYEKTGDYCMALKAYTLAGRRGNRNRKNLTNALPMGELSRCPR